MASNRKPEDTRMLVILPFEQIADWLSPEEDKADIDFLKSPRIAYPHELLESYTVPPLRGGSAVRDVPGAVLTYDYQFIGIL